MLEHSRNFKTMMESSNSLTFTWLLLLLFLDGNEETDNLLGLDHVVLVDLELSEDIVDLSLGHLASPGHQSVLEHLGVNLTFHIVSLESLNNEVVRVVAVSGHLLLEHLDHVVVGAGPANLSQELIQFRFCHEDTDVVEGSTEVILVNSSILVDVHHLEAVLVHLELLLGEALILSLAHGEVPVESDLRTQVQSLFLTPHLSPC